MDIKSKLVLRKNETFLRDTLPVDDILPRLFEEGVISDEDRERIKAEQTSREMISKLLSIIKRKQDIYGKFLEVLNKEECQFITEKLETTVIEEETLRKERQSDEDFVQEQLLVLFRESKDETVRYATLDDDIRQEICLHGKEFRPEKDFLKNIVEKTFPMVKYTKIRNERAEMVCIFKHLTRNAPLDDDLIGTGVSSRSENEKEIITESIEEQISLLFHECEGSEIEYSTMESTLKAHVTFHGKTFNIEQFPIKTIIQKTFPNVLYKKVRRSKRQMYLFLITMLKEDKNSANGIWKDPRM